MGPNAPNFSPGALKVVDVATAIGRDVLAVTAGAAPLNTAVEFIKQYAKSKVESATKVLAAAISQGQVELLTDEIWQEFVPSAYRFFEAARAGEYEHNLEILAECLVSGVLAKRLSASGFARVKRRIEGLEVREIGLIAAIHLDLQLRNLPAGEGSRSFVSAEGLFTANPNIGFLTSRDVAATLAEFAGRGILVPDGAGRWDKGEEYYFGTTALLELVALASTKMKPATDAEGN